MADPQQQKTDPFSDFHDVVRNAPTTAQNPYSDFNKVTKPANTTPPPAAEKPGLLDREINLGDHWYSPTLSGVQSIGRGVRDAVVGTGQLFDPRAHNDMEQTLVDTDPRNRVALPVVRTVNSIVDTAKQVPQILPAIRDINASPDPLTHYGKAAQEIAGQGAGQALTALATEGAVKVAPKLPGLIATDLSKGYVAPPVIRGVSEVSGKVGGWVRHPMTAVGDLADVVADKTGITNAVEKGKNFGLTPDQLRVKDMAPQVEKLQGNVNELQRRVDLASKTSSGYVPEELKSQLEAAQDKLRSKQAEAARVHPVVDQFARSLEEPEPTPAPVIGRPQALSKIPVASDVQPVRGNPAALAGEEKPFLSQVEGMVNKASGSTMPPVKGADLSIPSRPPEPALKDIPNRSYPTNPNLSASDASARVQDLLEQNKVARPSTLAAHEGLPGVSVARDVAGEAHPVKIVYDENGIPTSETDGRHRVMQAIERGDQRIEVTVDRGHGPVKTTVDPKVLARQMGVDKESLAATDAQQSYRKGGLQPREAVKGNGSMVNKLGDEVERSLGGEPGIKQGVPMKDQFKSSGMTSEKPVVKETSSRPETQAFIDHGLTKAEGTRITKTLDQINNASLGDFAAKNGVDMGQSTVSRAKGGAGSMNRGAVVKNLLSRMTPEQVEDAVNKYVGGE